MKGKKYLKKKIVIWLMANSSHDCFDRISHTIWKSNTNFGQEVRGQWNKKKILAVNMHTSRILTPRQILSKSFYNKMTGASYSIFISLNLTPTMPTTFCICVQLTIGLMFLVSEIYSTNKWPLITLNPLSN